MYVKLYGDGVKSLSGPSKRLSCDRLGNNCAIGRGVVVTGISIVSTSSFLLQEKQSNSDSISVVNLFIVSGFEL